MRREIEKREEREGRESERLKLSIMSTCGYAHGFLSSNRVISLILLKLEYYPSSAITYTWVTLRKKNLVSYNFLLPADPKSS